MGMNTKGLFLEINGFKWPPLGFPQENFHQIQSMELHPGDLVINTYPRCGTNWTMYMIWSIMNEGRPLPQPHKLMSDITFIDKLGLTLVEEQLASGSFRKMMSHVALPFFPFDSTVKYIVTIRNPFDCCISAFSFFKLKFLPEEQVPGFDSFFEIFMNGNLGYGDYFDHLIPWLEHRTDQNVKILIYEKMIKKQRECVLDLAAFLGKEYSARMTDEVIDKIVENTSFQEMKTKLDYSTLSDSAAKGVSFFRKGIVGDWKSVFSNNQRDRLKAKLQEKLKDSDILDFWLEELGI